MKKWAIFIMLIPIACLFLVGCGKEETKVSREESCDELTEDIMFFSEHSDGFSGGSRAGVEVTLHYDAEERMVKEESYIFGKGIDEEAKSKNGVQDSLQIPEDVRTEEELIEYIRENKPEWKSFMNSYEAGKERKNKSGSSYDEPDEKPIIYLYPTETTDVSVKLDYDGELTTTYPEYKDGWQVTAHSNGTLVDDVTGREYYGLYWEGIGESDYDLSKGFVVEGENTAMFLETTLSQIGLTDREINEFIIYWLPRMEKNPYNLISFQGEKYTEKAKLTVSPEPDSVLRVFMAWKAIDNPVDIEPQTFETFERNGFTVVEWGGAELK